MISNTAVARSAPQGGAKRCAVVAGGGLNVNVVEVARLQQPGHWRCNSSGLHLPSRACVGACRAAEMTADVEHQLCRDIPARQPRHVAMIVCDLGIRSAFGDQMFFEIAPRRTVGFTVITAAH